MNWKTVLFYASKIALAIRQWKQAKQAPADVVPFPADLIKARLKELREKKKRHEPPQDAA